MAGKARLITVESRNATIGTITATTIARLVGAGPRNVIAGLFGDIAGRRAKAATHWVFRSRTG